MSKRLKKLVEEALAIEACDAKEAGSIGYMARVLTQATMPHRKIVGNQFTRSNGVFKLSILAPSEIGLPYGTIPRLLLSWLTTEAVRTKQSEIVLGHTLGKFMSQLGLTSTGGRNGTIGRLQDQMQRLFSSTISCHYVKDAKISGAMGFNIAKEYHLWWESERTEQPSSWQSTVTLSHDFFEELITSPVPIDMRALRLLRASAMALDVYCWLTYRMSYLKKTTAIPWEVLEVQFGCDFERTCDFKKKFLKQLRIISVIYPQAKIEDSGTCLILRPSKPHVPMFA